MGNMKIKAKVKNDELHVKVQAKHINITYNAAKKKGVDVNFMTHISAKVGDRVVFDASVSQFISKDPIYKFAAKANGIKKGDTIEITWTDLSGKTVTESKKIK